ncbi:MAG: GIY-YIG nuclease family protein [Patescibacteria group bacterium]|jgi:predicted GIY-YIG superfamily endonuclease
MRYVYILKLNNGKFYTGSTDSLKQRLVDHNQGKCQTTTKKRPVKIVWYCAFDKNKIALTFEKYLKSGSGIAFRNKHLINK